MLGLDEAVREKCENKKQDAEGVGVNVLKICVDMQTMICLHLNTKYAESCQAAMFDNG